MHIVAAAGVLIVSVSCVTLSYPYIHILATDGQDTHASACSPRRSSKLLGANCSPRTPRLIRAISEFYRQLLEEIVPLFGICFLFSPSGLSSL